MRASCRHKPACGAQTGRAAFRKKQMTELHIPDTLVRDAFATALRMPPDTGSSFFADLRACIRRSLAALLSEQGIPARIGGEDRYRSRQASLIKDVAPIRHLLGADRTEHALGADFCFGYQFGEPSVKAVNYLCGGFDRPSLLPFRSIRGFSIGNIALDLAGRAIDIAVAPGSCFRVAGLALDNGARRKPEPFVGFLGVHFDFDALQPILDEVAAGLPADYLALDEVSSCSTPVLWIARHTGRLYTCSCFNGITGRHRQEHSVIDRLCCLCTGRTPRTKCGNEMYHTPFQRTWNPYLPIFSAPLWAQLGSRDPRADDIERINREAENLLREAVGHPRIGEKWKTETRLCKLAAKLFAPLRVIHHYHGDELEGLEFDIFVPDLRLAIEYHGHQHFTGVAYWGGEEGLATRLRNDEKKRRIAERESIDLVVFRCDEDLSDELVAGRLAPWLARKDDLDARDGSAR